MMRALASLAVLLAVAALTAPVALARGDSEREEVRVSGVCGERSRIELRVRADDGELRIDLKLRTSTRGVWRVIILHERRIARRGRVRSTRAERGFEYRVFLPDYVGPDEVRARAVSARGETCTAGTTLGAES